MQFRHNLIHQPYFFWLSLYAYSSSLFLGNHQLDLFSVACNTDVIVLHTMVQRLRETRAKSRRNQWMKSAKKQRTSARLLLTVGLHKERLHRHFATCRALLTRDCVVFIRPKERTALWNLTSVLLGFHPALCMGRGQTSPCRPQTKTLFRPRG